MNNFFQIVFVLCICVGIWFYVKYEGRKLRQLIEEAENDGFEVIIKLG